MFQLFAVVYKLPNSKETATTVLVDLDQAWAANEEEMGDLRRTEIRKMIACRRWGRAQDENLVELIEIARIGEPTKTP